jgi:hypothetical protein
LVDCTFTQQFHREVEMFTFYLWFRNNFSTFLVNFKKMIKIYPSKFISKSSYR